MKLCKKYKHNYKEVIMSKKQYFSPALETSLFGVTDIMAVSNTEKLNGFNEDWLN